MAVGTILQARIITEVDTSGIYLLLRQIKAIRVTDRQFLMQNVVNRKVALLNPPSAFLLQSKAIQALIWGIAAEVEQKVFTPDEVANVKKYMLPTYLEDNAFLGQSKFVRKPSLGREGDTVQIYHADGTLDVAAVQRNYESVVPIYQEYCPLPVQSVKTPSGKQQAYTLFRVFSIGGEASAIGVRVASTQITGNLSWFVPIGY